MKPKTGMSTRFWFGLVALVAALERLLLYFFYRPVSYSDTDSYRRLAGTILAGWAKYDGTRTPGYPVFMALVGPDERVYAAQLVLGLLTTLLFFYLGWRVSGRGWAGALAALVYSLNLQQLFFEANLITEALTTFLVTAAFAGMAWLLYFVSERPLWKILLAALGVGLLGGLAALTRPLFIFLPVWAAFFLVVVWRTAGLKVRWGTALAAGLSGLVLIAVWVGFIHQKYHRWSLTTMTGYHLVQHTGAFFEYVPDEYAALRDTYLEYRDARVAETGEANNAIWEAIPAMQQASGLNFYDLSDTLTRISLRLILEHPGLYLRSVVEGWVWFWKAPVYWSQGSLSVPALRLVLGAIALVERGVMVLANFLFLAGSLGLVSKNARQVLKMDAFLWFATSAIWLTSIVQTLLDHGDNPRFAVPMQTIIILLALWWSAQGVAKFIKAKGKQWLLKRFLKT